MEKWVLLIIALVNLATARINYKAAKERKDADRGNGQRRG